MKILIVGYGNMGQALEKLILEEGRHVVIDIRGKTLEKIDFNNVNDFDVLIDFSHPSNLDDILTFIKSHKKNAVLCTTGYKDEDLAKIYEASKHVAILYSRNMSLGIAIMKKAIREINKALDYSYDIEIIDNHHNKKLDAPSGTALMLFEELKKDYNYQMIERNHGNKKRSKDEIAIHSIRGGTVPGEHQVLFLGEDENLEIRHIAYSKKLFAIGSIRAAEFLLDKTQGFFTIDDIL